MRDLYEEEETREPASVPPLFRLNRYRQESGWQPPSTVWAQQWGEQVECVLLGRLREVFGTAGLRTFLDYYPEFGTQLRRAIVDAFEEGAYAQAGVEGIRRGNESMASVGRMMAALLNAPPDAPEDKLKIDVLLAYIGPPADAPESQSG